MYKRPLQPDSDLVRQEYVLVQAWKKASSFIRRHNWYSDTLELDLETVDLPAFLARLNESLIAPTQWEARPLRLVAAPKSHRWTVTEDGHWVPCDDQNPAKFVRPLAHVALPDQVVATALALCLADSVESRQGDPRLPLTSLENRRRVLSYGHRLLCDREGGRLQHRWGSSTFYRSFSQDYRTFVSRPERVAQLLEPIDQTELRVVHSDLSNFYDRVTPALLREKIGLYLPGAQAAGFAALANRVLNWRWSELDQDRIEAHARQAEPRIKNYRRVALPQGLVAAGFFANVVLTDFDDELRGSFQAEIAEGITLEDACRYVDDLRFVVRVDKGRELTEVEDSVFRWIQSVLNRTARGLIVSRDKTKAVSIGRDEKPLAQQSARMNRIQHAVSGGFDVWQGREILDAIQALVQAQQRFSIDRTDGVANWIMSPVPDVRDATLARFAANRFRTTYRSIRPLLEDEADAVGGDEKTREDLAEASRTLARVTTKSDLDNEARVFAFGLVQNWVEDPSNVRLLRVALDVWPDAKLLEGILALLRPYTRGSRAMDESKLFAWYCLAELFGAGATETAIVNDDESLPAGLDLDAYRNVLQAEALRILDLRGASVPWYVKQQALLFLATRGFVDAALLRDRSPETRLHRDLIRFLSLRPLNRWSDEKFANFAVLTRRALTKANESIDYVKDRVNGPRFRAITARDPSFALDLVGAGVADASLLQPRQRRDLGLSIGGLDETRRLAAIVTKGGRRNALRNEQSILQFALEFLQMVQGQDALVITPSDVELTFPPTLETRGHELGVKLVPPQLSAKESMYGPPRWCSKADRWRFQLGYLVRFILSAQPDFTRVVRPPGWDLPARGYRTPESHWFQRIYGMFNGHAAYGDDWLPVSEWLESFLYELLRWPGSQPTKLRFVRRGISATMDAVRERISYLRDYQGPTNGVFVLPWRIERPSRTTWDRQLRACVVQTVLPTGDELLAVPTANRPDIRRRHRNHLASILAAVDKMLDVRRTHLDDGGRLDWLILPELSVHPVDVRRHLVPFVRKHKCIVLAGLTYEEIFIGERLVNSALWIIPEWDNSRRGLRIYWRRQGKQYLAHNENETLIQGFRPCQWLIGYPWSNTERPLWLTASICYDATDLDLAAALRRKSDVYAIPAFNQDVNTFDQMAAALQYHMFQLVIVANNGQFGGSNAQIPYKHPYEREIFHLHGQPQASIGFVEIENISDFLERANNAQPQGATHEFKHPPAGHRAVDSGPLMF